MQNLQNIAIIPARKGSKGLPGKNIMKFCDKPLIYWTIKIAIESNIFDKIIVSTDCKNIAEISKTFGAEVPFLRPKYLATDTATSVDVAKHALQFFKENGNTEFKNLTLLEPTSPLREKDDLKKMAEFLQQNSKNFNALVSIGEVSENPAFLKNLLSDNKIEPLIRKISNDGRRQDQKPAYFPYGVAYISKVSTFQKELTFYPSKTAGYVIKDYQCIEIDSRIDFICAEAIARNYFL